MSNFDPSTTTIHPSAKIHETVSIGAYSMIGKNCNISEGVSIGNYCIIENDVVIGKNTQIKDYAHLKNKTQLGKECFINSKSVLGSEGFGYALDQKGQSHYIPQIGFLDIKDKVHIDSFCTIDRGALKNTEIQSNSFLGPRTHIAHNLKIGPYSEIWYHFVVAGSTSIGENFVAKNHVSLAGHVNLSDKNIYGDLTRITRGSKKPQELIGTPPMEKSLFEQTKNIFKNLPEIEKIIEDSL